MKVFLHLFGWQRSLHLLHLLLLLLCHEVAANTEIIRFSSPREQTVDLPLAVPVGNWPRLRPSENARRWTLAPAALHTPLHQVCEHVDALAFACPHELWVLLDLDDDTWRSFATFTLRLSWPASAPADFAIALYTQQDLLARLSLAHPVSTDTRPHTHRSATRVRYARLRAVHAGVPTPGLLPSNATVPLMLVLEPAYLGVLPASLLPTVCVLLAVLCVALACVVPRVLAYVEPLARQASADLHAGVTRTRKEQ